MARTKQWSRLMDLAGYPKTDYYVRQSLWIDKPMLYLTVNRQVSDKQERHASKPSWNWEMGDSLRVRCITNSDEAELFLNGKSLGRKSRKSVKEGELYWELGYQPGELLVKGFKDENEILEHTLKTTGEVSQMIATIDRESFDVRKKDLRI